MFFICESVLVRVYRINFFSCYYGAIFANDGFLALSSIGKVYHVNVILPEIKQTNIINN